MNKQHKSEFQTRFLNKTLACIVISLLVLFLAFSASWAERNLYIRLVAKQEKLTQENENTTNRNQSEDSPNSQNPKEPSDAEEKELYAAAQQDKMLEYLKKKYGKEFICTSYTAGSLGIQETMYAFPADGDRTLDRCMVEKKMESGELSYTDNYYAVSFRAEYEELFGTLLKELGLDESTTRISSRMIEVSEKLPDSPKRLMGHAQADTCLAVVLSDSDWETLAGRLTDMLNRFQMKGSCLICVVPKPEDLPATGELQTYAQEHNALQIVTNSAVVPADGLMPEALTRNPSRQPEAEKAEPEKKDDKKAEVRSNPKKNTEDVESPDTSTCAVQTVRLSTNP